MLVNLNDVLVPARKGKYAVGLFNTVNLELARGVMEAAEELDSPVIIGTAEVLLPYGPLRDLANLLIPMAERASVPVVVHLDHGLKEETCRLALELGFSSIMYDCSTMDYGDNMEHVKRMAETAHSYGASIEAELGHVGIMKEEALKEAALWLNRRSFTRIRSRRGISLTGPGQMLWPLPWARPMEPISFRLSWILTGFRKLQKPFPHLWSFTADPVCLTLISGQRLNGESARSIFLQISTRPGPGPQAADTGKE